MRTPLGVSEVMVHISCLLLFAMLRFAVLRFAMLPLLISYVWDTPVVFAGKVDVS